MKKKKFFIYMGKLIKMGYLLFKTLSNLSKISKFRLITGREGKYAFYYLAPSIAQGSWVLLYFESLDNVENLPNTFFNDNKK